ncbi:MAG: alpha-2-macroglobulin family protein, partial [Candidatus Electrothrix sp. AR3]|nr:alpha-2-macroglobulin family protein [Candidatus Electrothrix sp. AR3]
VQLLAADNKHGFTFLQLAQAPFDLSDRGVGGRAAPGPVDAFLYSERGIYRPGEEVNLVALVRDQLGRAVDGPPLTLRLKGPDGKVKLERLLPPDASGGYTDTINLSTSARSGTWSAVLYVDVEEKPVGQLAFLVKSFQPPRLEVRLESEGILTATAKATALVQADYLYGTPGADLAVQTRMSLLYDPHPFADFAPFFFGRAGRKSGISDMDLPAIRTDDKGQATLVVQLTGKEQTTLQPLKAVLHTEVMDIDGRAVAATASLPVRHLQKYIGVKPKFSDQKVQAESEATFEVIALDAKGVPQKKGQLSYRLIREEIDYQWFQKNGQWGYERIINDKEEQHEELGWKKRGPIPLSLAVGRGSYRLELLD